MPSTDRTGPDYIGKHRALDQDGETVAVKIDLTLSELKYILGIDTRLTNLETNMARIDAIIAQMNDATNAIAAKITRIQEQLEAGDTTAAAQLQPIADQLTALGADPSNPVPTA